MAPPKKVTPTVSDEFATEQASVILFRSFLPAKWIVRELAPDFGVDYLVEVVESGELTGLQVGVQLKGWQPKKNHQSPPKYPLKTKHLAYYTDKCLYPVLLVLVDLVRNKVYWAFMQKFGKEATNGWRKQGKIVVKFDADNEMSHRERFMIAVKEAAQYTNNLHPGSLKAALQQTKATLEAKDDRMTVDISIINGHQHFTFSAKEDLSFKVNFNPPTEKGAKAVKDFFEKGTDLEINNNEIKFTGSPLFDEILKSEGKLLIQHGTKLDGHVLFSWDNADAFSQVQIPAQFSRGIKYLACHAALPNTPLTISATLDPTAWDKAEPFKLSVGFQPRLWESRPVGTLPYFESIQGLFQAIVANKPLIMRFYIQGNLLAEAHPSEAFGQKMTAVFDFIEVVRKSRLLADHFKQPLVLPQVKTLKRTDFENIIALHDIIFEQGHLEKRAGFSLTLTSKKPIPPELKDGKGKAVAVISQHVSYTIFGTPITIGPVELHFSKMRLVLVPSDISEGQPIPKFEPTEESEQFVRLAKSEQPQPYFT
ncbi:MAG: hypothetical protein JWM68_1050 [Verrucomicrobiales bacterium]|nr:hypothetical protein [Verrucomicrobiales bacterium]